MADPVDWDSLRRVFATPALSAADNGAVVYLGERMTCELARDLIQERAAIREYDGDMARAKAQRLTALGLDAKSRKLLQSWDNRHEKE